MQIKLENCPQMRIEVRPTALGLGLGVGIGVGFGIKEMTLTSIPGELWS